MASSMMMNYVINPPPDFANTECSLTSVLADMINLPPEIMGDVIIPSAESSLNIIPTPVHAHAQI